MLSHSGCLAARSVPLLGTSILRPKVLRSYTQGTAASPHELHLLPAASSANMHKEEARMPEIKTEFLFKITLQVPSIANLGNTPYGGRRIAQVASGTFEGPKLKGEVLPGGGDWLLLRHDDTLQLDVRLILQTDDKQLIYMTYKG